LPGGNVRTVRGRLGVAAGVVGAGVRRAGEGARVGARPAGLRVATTMHRRTGEPGHERVDFFLVAERWRGEPRNVEPARCSELVWARLDDLPDDVIPYVRRSVEDYRRGVTFDSWGWETGTEPM